MTTPLDAASLVLEVLLWIGLGLGVPLLVAGYRDDCRDRLGQARSGCA
jgi:hypothetical protein